MGCSDIVRLELGAAKAIADQSRSVERWMGREEALGLSTDRGLSLKWGEEVWSLEISALGCVPLVRTVTWDRRLRLSQHRKPDLSESQRGRRCAGSQHFTVEIPNKFYCSAQHGSSL